MIPARLVLATGNPGKVEELRAEVAQWGPVEVLALDAFPGVACPEENDTSYVENAVLKARAVATATALPALGDDSGLEVDALGGAPGVRSARWAPSDTARIARLLAALRDVPERSRGARFRCVVALAWPEGRVETAEGACTGRIAVARSGSGGFGYDPVFVSDDLGTTFAAAYDADKRRVSHRARAMRALGDRLRGGATLQPGVRPC
ncbi:MAG TPA: RdgB/HAM1 family non-canonical purine NTP pyrophosphatase [Candidatus Binatia bacterium]|nr:RdgB/HAM1 family non-canonical purine NTP pyrophosphatase [Candidatus Binatia bacterium]